MRPLALAGHRVSGTTANNDSLLLILPSAHSPVSMSNFAIAERAALASMTSDMAIGNVQARYPHAPRIRKIIQSSTDDEMVSKRRRETLNARSV